MLMLTLAGESIFAALRADPRGDVLTGAHDRCASRHSWVHCGDAIFGPAVAQRLMHSFAIVRRRSDALPELMECERQILHRLAQNHGNHAIADLLVLSIKTVRNRISNICTKLQVVDQAQAIIRAREVGLG